MNSVKMWNLNIKDTKFLIEIPLKKGSIVSLTLGGGSCSFLDCTGMDLENWKYETGSSGLAVELSSTSTGSSKS